MQRIAPQQFKTQELPLARIKKIMKIDDDVRMISSEAPLLFAKAAQIFITELTLRAWIHTEDSKRRTLQRNDIANAVSKFDQFDFLIDIVPREEIHKTTQGDQPGNQTQSSQPAQQQQQQQQQSINLGTQSQAQTLQLQTSGNNGGQVQYYVTLSADQLSSAGQQIVVQPSQ